MTYTITTPLYYVNDKAHLGSTYTTIACDALARYKRLEGTDVVFVTGVDEHGQKIQRTAQLKNISPKEHCDQITNEYLSTWKDWNISNNRFVRTTSARHKSLVEKFYLNVFTSGDIYLGRQQGWYCVGCEEYKDVDQSVKNPLCSIHQKELEWRDEENLFFKLSKYQSRIEDLINKTDFINPRSRRKEVSNFVSNGLKDFSISRANVDWGIPVPDHQGHTFYVWFDALVGYLTAILDDGGKADIKRLNDCGWPAEVHVIGKDILRFHAIYWPAMLMSAGLKPPVKVFGHGFLTREGQKMGKSIGNVLDPADLLSNYGRDSIRWFLLRDIEFGQDGDFQKKRFIEIINNDLANTIGNLLNRTSSMSRKWFEGRVPDIYEDSTKKSVLAIQSTSTISDFKNHFEKLEFKLASESILTLASSANVYLNDKAPWKKMKIQGNEKGVSIDIYNVLEATRIIGLLLNPIVPDLSYRILIQLGCENHIDSWTEKLSWGLLIPGSPLPVPEPVMDKLEFIDDV